MIKKKKKKKKKKTEKNNATIAERCLLCVEQTRLPSFDRPFYPSTTAAAAAGTNHPTWQQR
jgi:hypothetical protein